MRDFKRGSRMGFTCVGDQRNIFGDKNHRHLAKYCKYLLSVEFKFPPQEACVTMAADLVCAETRRQMSSLHKVKCTRHDANVLNEISYALVLLRGCDGHRGWIILWSPVAPGQISLRALGLCVCGHIFLHFFALPFQLRARGKAGPASKFPAFRACLSSEIVSY